MEFYIHLRSLLLTDISLTGIEFRTWLSTYIMLIKGV